MTDRPIGYYVHHHGAGHLARARAIADAVPGRITLLGTGIGPQGIDLADDRCRAGSFDGEDDARNRADALHYAPLDHDGVRSRVAAIARWIDAFRPSLMIVDVSVEIAMLARLASVPVVYVRLNGDRHDTPHLEAFRGAVALMAPYHADLDTSSTLPWVRDKTRYLPGITAMPRSPSSATPATILVVIGRGGQPGDGDFWAQAARTCPQWRWRVIGPCSTPDHAPDNIQILGWVQDAAREITHATLVVGAAGDGLVNGVLAADRPFICMPEDRPFNEQHATAERLASLGAAVVASRWPESAQWPGLIAEALALRPEARRRLHDPDGDHAAAEWIESIAGHGRQIRAEAA